MSVRGRAIFNLTGKRNGLSENDEKGGVETGSLIRVGRYRGFRFPMKRSFFIKNTYDYCWTGLLDS